MYPTLESRADILRMMDEIREARKKILERCDRLSAAKLSDVQCMPHNRLDLVRKGPKIIPTGSHPRQRLHASDIMP